MEVHKTEEKGSDVNIATNLLLDAFDNDFDVAWVMSNDSDLAFPIDVVRTRFTKDVGILNPRKRLARGLKVPPSLHRTIKPGALAACQFPSTLKDTHGTIHKPATW